MKARTRARHFLAVLLMILVIPTIMSCSSSPESRLNREKPITAAELFQRMVKEMEERRAKEPWDKRRYANNPYDMLEAKIEDWLGTPEGRFAHSIKIPNTVPEDSGYRPGMTQQEYFEHLCKNEAGEFIFKTVDNVDGIYQIRPRRIYSRGELQHLYALEDPYGYWVGENEEVGFQLVNPLLYSYFEVSASARTIYTIDMVRFFDPSLHAAPPPNGQIARYADFDGIKAKSMKLEYDSKPRAKYGFTWRGVQRPHDRELGIAGGELIALDLQTNEVLGVRRGYVIWNRGWTGRMCPRYGYSGGQDKTTYFSAWFLAKVIRPARWQEFFAIEEKARMIGDPAAKHY